MLYENQQVACFVDCGSFATFDALREIRRCTRPRGMGARNVEVTTFRETDETPEIVGQLFARPKARRICALNEGKHELTS